MNAAQRKKAKAIARKRRNQAEKKEAERLKREEATAENGDQKKDAKKSPIDEDPNGEALLKKDALEEGKKYSAILSKHCPSRSETWAFQYDVSIRRKKWLLALQALLKMRSIDSENAEFFSRLVDFASKMSEFEAVHDAVKRVVSEEVSKLLNQKSVTDYIADAAEQARKNKVTTLSLRIAIADALFKMNPASSVDSATAIIVDGGIDSRDVNVDTCRAALKMLKSFGSGLTEQWISSVRSRFPRITEFR
jgi:peptide alpha-N-acetyltransferase